MPSFRSTLGVKTEPSAKKFRIILTGNIKSGTNQITIEPFEAPSAKEAAIIARRIIMLGSFKVEEA